ncbi:MAG TPA: M20/M25/M40 family metallo-hydrolase [Candidatus Poseidoniaceae archaeon]|nr:M20/M25/M40 family metallo-hydrolase [Candidatus Poseidoniaceae archaeon]
MGRLKYSSMLMILLMLNASIVGCFSSDEEKVSSTDLSVGIEILEGGYFQNVFFTAKKPLSVYIPYLIMDDSTGFVQNSTIINIQEGQEVQISILPPPRITSAFFFVGEYNRDFWPIRDSNESWQTWIGRNGHINPIGNGIQKIVHEEKLSTINASMNNGIESIEYVEKNIHRSIASAYSVDEGGKYSMGIVDGRSVYNTLEKITDETINLFDLNDGAVGYLDRWAGQGNTAYEDAALFIRAELESFGLDVKVHRFEFTDIFGNQNPESYNVCGYHYGTEFPDEWLVFGAHFDIAPPANAGLIDPHDSGSRTYGTRVGAYDNTAGTSMVLTAAEALTSFDTRRTMVFCLWSGEEGGKRGSNYWTEYYVLGDNPDVTVTNYINLDMAGVNWPGGGGAPCGDEHGGGENGCDPDPTPDEDGYPKDAEVWPMRVYIGPSINHDNLDQAEMVYLNEWIGTDAIGVEEQQRILVASNHSEDTWKFDVWMEEDRPEIIVYEDTTARSDHASFQDVLGTITVGYGGLVDGYWCYHQTCDTLEEMEDWMDTTEKEYGNNNTGVENLVNSLDIITWYAIYNFFHLDEKPILNTLD